MFLVLVNLLVDLLNVMSGGVLNEPNDDEDEEEVIVIQPPKGSRKKKQAQSDEGTEGTSKKRGGRSKFKSVPIIVDDDDKEREQPPLVSAKDANRCSSGPALIRVYKATNRCKPRFPRNRRSDRAPRHTLRIDEMARRSTRCRGRSMSAYAGRASDARHRERQPRQTRRHRGRR